MPQKKVEGATSPYVEYIVATLTERIQTGVYPGGRWLPTERELCTEFDVSRALLRQALVALEHTDLVIRGSGCRPFVKAHGERALPRIETTRRTIGLCVKLDPKYSGTYQITQGVREAVDPDTMRLLIGGTNAITLNAIAADEAQTLLSMVQDEDISGIILWHCGLDINLPVLHKVQAANIPLVFVDRAPGRGIEADYIGINNRQAAREAVQYLLRRGHRRIAHITNPEPVSTVYERMAGYKEAITEAGLSLDRELLIVGRVEGMAEEGLTADEIVSRLLKLPDPPTALFAVTDYVALTLVRALQEQGKRVPDDIAIIGFDDLEQWFPQKPFLTTIRQPFERIGVEAVHLLRERLESGPRREARHVMLESSLIVRESA